MFVTDIDRKLDMCMVVSFRGESDFFSIFRKYGGYAPAYGYSQGSDVFLDVFMIRNGKTHVSELLKPFGIVTKGDYDVIRGKREQTAGTNALFVDLFGIPSLIMNGLYVEGGELYAEMRFHHSSMSAVSDVIGRFSREMKNFTLRSLGPSPGIIRMLDKINARFPLFVVGYEGLLPPNPVTGQIRNVERITEPNFAYASPEGYRAVVYSRDELDASITRGVISRDEGILETYGSTPFVLDFWRTSGDRHIPRYAVFAKISEGKFTAFTFIPALVAEDQLHVIYEVAERHPDSGFRLSCFTPYDEGIWEWV